MDDYQNNAKTSLVDWAIKRKRATMLVLAFFVIAGIFSYQSIPKESEPDIAIPFIYVSVSHDGISPEDAERLLVKPIEKELKSIEGVNEMTSVASEGHASVTLEFDAGFDPDIAVSDVQKQVDRAKSKLPDDSDEPSVNEINVALFPVLSLSLSGPISERYLLAVARDLRDDLEALGGVLEVEISGDRDEALEVIVDPLVLETYNIHFEEVLNTVARNNRLVAAGAIQGQHGRQVLKVSGVIEDPIDILTLPVKTVDGNVVKVADIATVSRTFKEPSTIARVNGESALTLSVKKRVGANIIEVIEQTKSIVSEKQAFWPETLKANYILDKSTGIRDMLSDLQNNVLSAILMVMIVVVGALGIRSSILVGFSIPASFLASIVIIHQMGLTMNIVVLFSLILVVGMLVDGAIVVTELASRNAEQGMTPAKAFAAASKRMAWPIIASTATTLAVFLPLVAWPGTIGEFMKFLPITVVICLAVSLVVALVFLPVVGSWIGSSASRDSLTSGSGKDGIYGRMLASMLRRPWTVLVSILGGIVAVYVIYAELNNGVEFFPDVEPETAQILVHARGDLSIFEKDRIVKKIERRFLAHPGVKSVYARSASSANSFQGAAEDVAGIIQFQFEHWSERKPASEILADMEAMTADMAGIKIEYRKSENGPSEGKPIQLQVSATYPENAAAAVAIIQNEMERLGGFVGIEDDRPLPGIEWQINVDREVAAQYGADVALIGAGIQMVTAGLKTSEYRPEDTDEELDIVIRFPPDQRSLNALETFRIQTNRGMVPLSNFIELTPAPKTGTIRRSDGKRAITLKADVAEGMNVQSQLERLQADMPIEAFSPDVRIAVKGEQADQQETMVFLGTAFLLAIFLMLLILVTQFNSFYQGFLVLSAIVFSTAGVLIGLLLTGQSFGVVMVGLGIIALAGIVVNNNIVLIDTYNVYREEGLSPYHAALETGKIRMRPVLLTAGTTILGLIPMVLAMNIDFVDRVVTFGAPSTQWWTQLSSAIAGGLGFATLLTLFLTPCLLLIGDRKAQRAFDHKHPAEMKTTISQGSI